jgi:hypothetical protein
MVLLETGFWNDREVQALFSGFALGLSSFSAVLIQEEHGVGRDRAEVLGYAVGAFVGPVILAALDEDHAALGQVLIAQLGQLAPAVDVVPRGFGGHAAISSGVLAVSGDRELGDGLATRRVLHLRVFA